MDASKHPTNWLWTPLIVRWKSWNLSTKSIISKEDWQKFALCLKKRFLTITSLICWRDVSSPSKTLLYLSRQMVQKITCGINKTHFSVFPTKSSLPSQEMIPHRVRNNPRKPQSQKRTNICINNIFIVHMEVYTPMCSVTLPVYAVKRIFFIKQI